MNDVNEKSSPHISEAYLKTLLSQFIFMSPIMWDWDQLWF